MSSATGGLTFLPDRLRKLNINECAVYQGCLRGIYDRKELVFADAGSFGGAREPRVLALYAFVALQIPPHLSYTSPGVEVGLGLRALQIPCQKNGATGKHGTLWHRELNNQNLPGLTFPYSGKLVTQISTASKCQT